MKIWLFVVFKILLEFPMGQSLRKVIKRIIYALHINYTASLILYQSFLYRSTFCSTLDFEETIPLTEFSKFKVDQNADPLII